MTRKIHINFKSVSARPTAMRRAGRIARSSAIALAGALLLAAPSAQAQEYDVDGGAKVLAGKALAVIGLGAIPSRSAQLVSLKGQNGNDDKFRSLQIGGGKTLSGDLPIYLEGYLGYQNYKSTFILSNGISDVSARANWDGLVGTGGIGWNFQLDPYWSVKPLVNFSVGQIKSDVTLSSALAPSEIGDAVNFLSDGKLTTGGYGAGILLEYKLREQTREIDFSLRQTYMHFKTIGSSSDLDASANALTTSAWVRARYPIGSWRVFNSPVRSVWQAGASAFDGSQSDVLGSVWLANVGVGLELGTENTGLPLLTRARLMVNYAFNSDFNGVAVGIGLSF